MPKPRPSSSATPAAVERSVGQLLNDAVRLLRRDFYERAGGLNLTPALARLLYHVNREGNASQVELASKLEISPVTLGRMVDRLVRLRYVRREPDGVDRRVFRVVVDTAGQALVGRMAALSAQTEARALRGISRDERRRLFDQIARICRNLHDEGD